MTIIRSLTKSKYILLLLLISCSTTKKSSKPDVKNECYIIETKENVMLNDMKPSILRQIQDFNKDNYKLQILHIKTIQGYDYQEDSEVIYLKNNVFFSKNSEGIVKKLGIDLDLTKEKLEQIDKTNFLGYCKKQSTKNIINYFYLKENDTITFSFVFTGRNLKHFYNNISSNELSFLQYIFNK